MQYLRSTKGCRETVETEIWISILYFPHGHGTSFKSNFMKANDQPI